MSSHIRARKHKAKPLAAFMTLAFPAAAMAQQAVTLPEVDVQGQASAYKADVSANPKYTQPLVDTPQTISIIKKETFTEQGAATLMDALRNTPGLTSQIGENGSLAAGDTFTMRGVSNSQTSLFVDGIRNLGAITRDIYNVEQVEVVKGPAGADIGRGAGAGYINMVTKLPSLEDATTGSVSVGSANMKRGTIDYNKKTGDDSAIRLNAMVQDSGVPGRDYVKNTGWAFAPSAGWGLGTSTRVYLYGEVLHQDNVPDSGIPAIGINGYSRTTASSALTAPGATAAVSAGSAVNRNNFYGSTGDYEHVDGQTITAKVEHDLDGGGTVRNITRIGRIQMVRVSHSPFLVFPNATGSAATLDTNPANWTVSTSNQGLYQINDVVANQTSLSKTLHTGAIKHDLVTGLELSYERQRNNTFTSAGTVYNNLYNPTPNMAMPALTETGAYTDGYTNTAAAYVSDTMKLNPAWQFTGALRVEQYRTVTNAQTTVTTSNATSYPGYATGALAPSSLSAGDTLVSWKLGGVYKPAKNGSIYAAVANSQTPPGSAAAALSITTSNANSPFLKPQEFLNKEIGTKWDFLDSRLGLAVALYETGIKNETPVLQSDGTYVSSGDRTVSGIETTLVGALTKNWSISAGIATMHTKMNQGIASTSTSASNDTVVGASTRYSPTLTGTLWSTWTQGPWSVGGGARYVSEQKRIVGSLATGTTSADYSMPTLPSYVVYDAMASYQVSKNVTLRLNLYNLTNKFYITGVNGNGQANSGGRLSLGTPRYGMLTASFAF